MFQPQPTPFAASCFTSYGLAPELGFDSEYPVPAGGGGAGAPAGLYSLQPQQQPAAPSHQHPHLAHHQQPSLSPAASSPFAPSTTSTISTTSPPPPTPTHHDTLQTHRQHLHHQPQLQHRSQHQSQPRPQVQVQHPHQLQHLSQQQQQHHHHQLQQLQHQQLQHQQLQSRQAPQQSYPRNGIIVPKMEDQEGQHGMAAQQAAAKDYQAGPFVGSKVSSEAITNEYAKADHIYVEKTVVRALSTNSSGWLVQSTDAKHLLQALPQTYSHYRPIQGDGNCGWRAIGFAYFEKLIESGDQGKVEGEVARLISFGQMITSVGGYSYFEEWADEMFGLLREIAQNIDNPQMAHMLLLERWNDASVGGSIIYYLRLVAATFLKANAHTYDPFLPEGAGGVQGYCSQSIELVDREIEHLGIIALTQMLLQPCDFVLEIAYLDRSPGSQVNRYRFPEEANGQNPTEIGPIIYLLYRPDHYDILYVPTATLPVPVQVPAPAAPVSMQVNRVNSLSHNTPITSTQTNLGEYSSVDFSALSMIPGFMGGMAPLAAPPPSASSAETYSPASVQQSPWMTQFPDGMPATSQQAQPAPAIIASPQPSSPPAPMSASSSLGPNSSMGNSTMVATSGLGPQTTLMPPLRTAPGYHIRFSQVQLEYEESKNSIESHFNVKTNTFKNSIWNRAHYGNPDFHPEEWSPDDEHVDGRVGAKRKLKKESS
ncbi:hypothetical protein AK830_g7367 [Neonectria ditissima]|uniref:ubiquitinyl hydrolase 1 n=1 Tax=Neonectria ditissima TaxID=78410 RepID=A0A0P7BGE3_9HYPO|nr:hypothetical protein AK830_g7367 [Neonectria ditissima]